MSEKCPEIDELRAFAIGDLAGVQLECIATHVATCGNCDSALAEFDGYSDGFVSDLKRLNDEAPPTIDREVVRAAIEAVDPPSGTTSSSISLDPGRAYARRLADGPVRLGRFELINELGDGAFGYVFRARDDELQRDVAVKIGRAGSLAGDDEIRRFLREARAAAQLSHPHIVAIHDSGQTEDGVCYLVSEFIEGDTLESRMQQIDYEPSQAAELVVELAEALGYAHRHNVIHRDVKPSNILIDRGGHPHIADFGLAKRLLADQTLTSDGRVMGTPAYMSPEQACGESHRVDARSDVYSLGVVFYELLTGERPFQGGRRLIVLQVLEDEPLRRAV